MNNETCFDKIVEEFTKTELCNSFIKSAFLPYLYALKDSKFNFTHLSFVKNESCCFEIKCQNNNHIKIIFDFWRFNVNIYIGEEKVHYADDASVKNEKEQERFKNELDKLFYSNVHEIVSSNNYRLLFKSIDNITIIELNSKLRNLSPYYNRNHYEKVYEPWLIGSVSKQW